MVKSRSDCDAGHSGGGGVPVLDGGSAPFRQKTYPSPALGATVRFVRVVVEGAGKLTGANT